MSATSSPRRTRCSLLVALLVFFHGQSQAADSLETIGDKLAIAAALAQYSYSWDGKDAAGFADIFTLDGIMERWLAGSLVAGSRIVGKQAIQLFFECFSIDCLFIGAIGCLTCRGKKFVEYLVVDEVIPYGIGFGLRFHPLRFGSIRFKQNLFFKNKGFI